MGFCYYKMRLSFREKIVYDQIVNGFQQQKAEIKVNNIESGLLSRIIDYIRLDHPAIYYLGSVSYKISRSGISICPNYIYSVDQITCYTKEISKSVNHFYDNCTTTGVYNRLLYLHDYIVSSIQYLETGKESHNIIGPIVQKTAVCEGLAEYVKLVCDAYSIPCVTINGKCIGQKRVVQNNHSWNGVIINGFWYYCDFTFDNTINQSNPCAIPRYDYFCIQAKDMQSDHFGWSVSSEQSACRIDYFTSNNLVVSSAKALLLLLTKQIKNGQDVVFKVSETWHDFNCEEEIMHAVNSCQTSIQKYTYSYNPSQGVCYLHTVV